VLKEKAEMPLTSAEIYAKAVAARVLVEKLDSKGQPFVASSGFFVDDGVVLTAFRAIDGAHGLGIRLANGTHFPLDSVLAWNRRQDWALLKIDGGKSALLPKANGTPLNIGDHCYWLDVKAGGGALISEGQIVGKEEHADWGERISISGPFNSTATGGPLLDEHGAVLGLLGGELPEIQRRTGGETFTLTGTAVPIHLVRSASNPVLTPLQTLWATNQFTMPVTALRDVSYGMITQGKSQKSKGLRPKELKVDFTRSDEFASVVIAFQGIESLKNTAQLQVYDMDNRALNHSDPIKINLRSGEIQERVWTFPLSMQPGLYRADVTVGEEVAWRQYFRVRE
jgi:hypothetical protein